MFSFSKIPMGLILLNGLLVVGCTSALKKRCVESDWHKIGEQHALEGQQNMGDQENQRCQTEKVEINLENYNAGYEVGRQQYCSEGNGQKVAMSGNANPKSICSKEAWEFFQKGYKRGLVDYCRRENILKVAIQGAVFPLHCPKEKQQELERNFQIGHVQFLNNKIVSLMAKIESLERQLVEEKSENSSLERKVSDLRSQVSSLETKCN